VIRDVDEVQCIKGVQQIAKDRAHHPCLAGGFP
jgi:hypothetical protein